MFHDLKDSFDIMIENAAEEVDGFISIDKWAFDNFVREYNLCFVEPEDDEDWQAYQDSDNESTSS